MRNRVLVTGAAGNVGAEVVHALVRKNVQVRAADLKVEKLHALLGDSVEAVAFDFGQPETVDAALVGVDKLFLMRPPAISDVKTYLFPVIDKAKAVGVKQIVFLSLIGIEKNKIVPHYKVEQYLRVSGLPYTFLRPSFFMQNLNTTHRDEIRLHHEIAIPVGRSKTSFIDVRDIGAVAALALTEAGHDYQAYDLTGPEALDYHEVAQIYSEVLAHKVTYRSPSLLTFVRQQRAKGLSMKFVLVMLGLYTSTRLGMANKVTDEVQRLLGRPPISFRQYVEDYKACWL